MSDLFERGRKGQSLRPLGVIDMHAHLGMCKFAVPDISAASHVRVMDRLGVESMLCSHIQSTNVGVVRGNDEVLAAMRDHPGRILGYLSVWPWEEARVRAEVARCLDAGFVGVKVHNSQGFPYTHDAYAPAYEAANERRLPVLMHTWGHEREFRQIDEMARRYPEASILLAHAGCENEEGYFRMAREHGNVFLDTAYSVSPRGLVERLVAGAGVEKVVWGSDAHFFSQSHQIGKVLGAALGDDVKAAILSGNAKRILARVRGVS